ncbi:LPS assembly lipoprotein LptE [Herbaspirillum rhizosphaerae]|uniref:LPS-assembly lipoprotein LptE n=1 Tax=Herbaspirillum rhizosphaerae TaxID=346179 RepID=UPI00067D3689|nr:LPS assembly lipoprotein LptE [Herbaspirillum rhizosphaerae]
MPFQLHRRKALQWFLMLLAAGMLSACGFHMRGPAQLPFKSIYLGFSGNSSLGTELKRYIRASGVQVTDSATEAEAILQVLADTREKKILSLNTNGQVREYSLYQRFSFLVKDQAGKVLIAPASIVLKRDITYDANQELAKQAEEALLYRDMQTDLVQQILRRLSATKTNIDETVEE